MNKSYSKQDKEKIIKQYESGFSITSIHNSTGIARSTLYKWVNECNSSNNIKSLNKGDYNKLKMHCEKLENIIQILKICGCTVDAPLRQRFEVIKELSTVYSITTLCDALNVPKGSYYNHIFRNKNGNTLAAQRIKELTPVVEEIYNESKQIFGAGKITAIMNDRGYKTTEKTVAKIMHANGWFSIKSSSKTIYLQNKERKENILKQQFKPGSPNEVWVSDVTYFVLNGKRYFICVVLDLYARKIISYTISKRNSTWLTKTCLINAYEERDPDTSKLLFHTDQGRNYTAKAFRDCLISFGIQQSFSRKGVPYDNSVCESFFKSLKQEELYRTNYRSEKHLRKSLGEYIIFYNERRPHSYLRNRTPNKAESDYYHYSSQKEKVSIEQ
ncbi:MAG: IS3 family transposase [Ruminococcaceae bacterium]|nr:IS3 family transposase [Oscillospiraceae bacterium]